MKIVHSHYLCNVDYTKDRILYINRFCLSLQVMKTVLITGGTGMLGTALTRELLKKGYEVIILTRSNRKINKPGITYATWDIEKGTIDPEAISNADYIVHLAGANLAGGRWTNKRKRIFTESRVRSGGLLVKALKEIPNKVQAVISSSAIGFYGADEDGPGRPFVESYPPDHNFLGQLVLQWEEAVGTVTSYVKRLVILRFAMILSTEGGALKEFLMPLKFGVSTILGSGRQMVSWIHIDDATGIIMASIENENIKGVYNAVAPDVVSNKVLMRKIASNFNGYYIKARVPAGIIKLVFGEMSIEVLKSATVSSEKIINEQYEFLFPGLESAIQNLAAS